MGIRVTNDDLPIVTEETFLDFFGDYDISSAENDPEVTSRIEQQNPQIYRILSIGMGNAPNSEARVYYEMGVQVCYELLRRQGIADSER